MSKDYIPNSSRKVIIVRKENPSFSDNSYDEYNLNDVTKVFDCRLKISITNKLAQLSGRNNESRVSIGPSAEIDQISEKKQEKKKTISSPALNGTSSPRSPNLTFSKKKILLENEIQRKENVKKIIEQKKKEMETSAKNSQDVLSALLSKMALQKEKESAEKLAQLEAEEEQLALQLERDRKNKMEQKRLQESEDIMKKIIPFQTNFHTRIKDIATICKNCKDKAAASQLLNEYSISLKDSSYQMDAINMKAETGDLTPADMKMAEMVSQFNDQIFVMFQSEIEHIEAMYDKEIARREMELRQAELEVQKEALLMQQLEEEQNILQQQFEAGQTIHVEQVSQVDGVAAVDPPPYHSAPVSDLAQNVEVVSSENESESSDYPDTESWQIYLESSKFLEQYKLTFDDFIKSDTMKKFKFECQKTLNITINSISHVSREQLIDKYEKLRNFLSGKGSPNILLNPKAEAFSKNLLAKKIVDQGVTTISSKPELAFPFAAIAVAIWNDWPDFGQLLLAHFRTVSPFFVPVFLMPRPDQSDEDYYKSLGCKYNEDGTPEKPEQFWKRLGGIMYLYASILVTKQRQGVNKPHPHGIGNAWRWLAATLNIEPRRETADICATLIYIILEITGNDLWKTYPNQFPKMLHILDQNYCSKLKNFDPVLSAPISRLGDFLSSALQKGSIPAPTKQLPPNFW